MWTRDRFVVRDVAAITVPTGAIGREPRHQTFPASIRGTVQDIGVVHWPFKLERHEERRLLRDALNVWQQQLEHVGWEPERQRHRRADAAELEGIE